MEKLRILYYCLASDVFGGVRVINNQCNLLAERGHHVGYSALNASSISWLPEKHTTYHPHEINPREWDIIVCTEVNTWAYVHKMITPAKKFSLVQALEWRFFEQGNPKWSEQVRQYYYWHDLEPICIAKYLVKEMKKFGHEKAHLVSWGLDFDLFHPDEPIHPKGDKVRILIEGHNLGEVKDRDNLARKAIEYVGRDNVEVWGLSSQPPIEGFEYDEFYQLPPQDMLRRIYSACDILIKASRFEGKPAPPFEAMACGCAVVAALNQGTDDLVYGKNCLLSQYDGLKLNRNLKKLVEDDSLRGELIANGLEYVREHFQWEDKISRIETIFQEAVDGK